MTAGITVAVASVVILYHSGVALRPAARVGAGAFLGTFMVLSLANEIVLPRSGGFTVGMQMFGLLSSIPESEPSLRAGQLRLDRRQ